MNYIRITEENIDKEHICCAMSGKQSLVKKEWLKRRFPEGLVFYRSEERGKCFIEYIPAENAWVPIEAAGYLYINCLWVSGSMKGHGYSSDLLDECIRPKNQRYIAVSIEGQQSSPSLSQAQKMRELDKDGKLNGDVIDGILSQEKKEVDKVIINSAELEKYFGKDKSPREMKDKIISLLDDWKAKQPPELGKPEKKTDLEK